MQNSNVCPVCNISFSRRDVMLRHKRNIHSEISENHPPGIPLDKLTEPSLKTPLNMSHFKFQHPCSIMLTGPSGCGKTVLTKKIICDSLIDDPPQRIIWCYGQYQPLYDDVKSHLPGVEFVKGIPDFIEQDTYLDTRIRNCIILDDLMGDAKKDERVANLFTKGSHHRNLTVIFLTQNLFPQGKACRDISLNTKYLVLFNNPVDRFQVMTLARRIYPTNSHLFMKEYEQAISKPYGHLLVDLRVNTPEHERLKQNILDESNPIQDSIPHVEPNVIRAPHYHQNSDGRPPLNCQYSVSSSNSSEESDFNLDMPICNDCGIMFGDSHALQQHVKQWCLGQKRKLQNGDNTDESEPKKMDNITGT